VPINQAHCAWHNHRTRSSSCHLAIICRQPIICIDDIIIELKKKYSETMMASSDSHSNFAIYFSESIFIDETFDHTQAFTAVNENMLKNSAGKIAFPENQRKPYYKHCRECEYS
jgi:hypothetical protein